MSLIMRILPDQRGLTLVEVIIAIFLVAAGLVAVMWVIPVATGHIHQSKLKTTAVFLAQQRVEQIKNARWTAVPAADNLGGGGSDGSAEVLPQWPDEGYNTIPGYGAYKRTVRIIDCAGTIPNPNPCGLPTPNGNVRQVTVTVFFHPMTGAGNLALTAEDGAQVTTLVAQR